jgi:TBC1 domain family member 5
VTRIDGNINTTRPWHSPRSGSLNPRTTQISNHEGLIGRTEVSENRNKVLAGLLEDAINELRLTRGHYQGSNDMESSDSFNRALTKVKSVQKCLEDPFSPTPPGKPNDTESHPPGDQASVLRLVEGDRVQPSIEPSSIENNATAITAPASSVMESSASRMKDVTGSNTAHPVPLRPTARSLLAESDFSWMLGDEMHRSSFISSMSFSMEQDRHGDGRSKHTPLFRDNRETGRGKTSDEDDGLALSSLRGDNDYR